MAKLQLFNFFVPKVERSFAKVQLHFSFNGKACYLFLVLFVHLFCLFVLEKQKEKQAKRFFKNEIAGGLNSKTNLKHAFGSLKS